MKTTAILIAGKAGVGKSTLANIIAEQLNLRGDIWTQIIPMAKKVKEVAATVFGWRGEKDERGRRLLQHLGTEIGREYDPNVWVHWAIKDFDENCDMANRMSLHPLPYCIMIADDVRFPNEIEECKKCFDSVYVIYVCGESRTDMPADTSQHPSETSLYAEHDYVQGIVYNTGSMRTLEWTAIWIAEHVISELED